MICGLRGEKYSYHEGHEGHEDTAKFVNTKCFLLTTDY